MGQEKYFYSNAIIGKNFKIFLISSGNKNILIMFKILPRHLAVVFKKGSAPIKKLEFIFAELINFHHLQTNFKDYMLLIEKY